jgi:hypothetical protein
MREMEEKQRAGRHTLAGSNTYGSSIYAAGEFLLPSNV